ncbi:FkbM family methyltransferase, partial [Pelagibacterales bacterium SAG-MED20]|nr:FkbM family methyltransferase [Pelagibacterales bacterium SAG-MED20]
TIPAKITLIFLSCAISNKTEIIKLFYQKELSQLSTTESNQAKTVFQGNIKEKEIQAFTLDEILNRGRFKNSKIDFLDVDVEGADLKVLEGLSFDIYKPELVCVEINEKEIKQSVIYNFLIDKDYELIWSGIFSHLFKRL